MTRPEPVASARTILVGDVEAGAPLAVALDLAQGLRARVHVVYVITRADHPVDPDLPDWEDRLDRPDPDRRHAVTEAAAQAGVACTYEVREGDPATELVAAAEQCDATMIVVGTRGEGIAPALSRLFLPSVSHGVISRQRRPVLVVPSESPEPG